MGGMLIGRAVCCKRSLLEVGLIGEEVKWRKGLLAQLISKGRLIGGSTVMNKTIELGRKQQACCDVPFAIWEWVFILSSFPLCPLQPNWGAHMYWSQHVVCTLKDCPSYQASFALSTAKNCTKNHKKPDKNFLRQKIKNSKNLLI